MDSHLLISFYYFVCPSGYLKSFEQSWSALQSSHCSSATDADHKVKANTKKPATQNPFFFSQGMEGEHIHISLSCSSQFPIGEQHQVRLSSLACFNSEYGSTSSLQLLSTVLPGPNLLFHQLPGGGGCQRSPWEHLASSEDESAGAWAACAPPSWTALLFPQGNSWLWQPVCLMVWISHIWEKGHGFQIVWWSNGRRQLPSSKSQNISVLWHRVRTPGQSKENQTSPVPWNIWPSTSDQWWCQIVPNASGLLSCLLHLPHLQCELIQSTDQLVNF